MYIYIYVYIYMYMYVFYDMSISISISIYVILHIYVMLFILRVRARALMPGFALVKTRPQSGGTQVFRLVLRLPGSTHFIVHTAKSSEGSSVLTFPA